MDINLNKEFNNILSKIDLSNKPNLFLHVCCGPCSTSVLDRIFNYFNIYIIFANSNIDTFDEFILRYNEFLKVLTKNNYNFKIIFNQYDHKDYLSFINGLEKEPEGGKRCIKCFEYRLKQTFFIADNSFCIEEASDSACAACPVIFPIVRISAITASTLSAFER